ncbi:MAG: M1 family metallopeptidase [Vicingus serpentipes]|nr:M1 family metallopeptidase [Vicingus serpentipes]
MKFFNPALKNFLLISPFFFLTLSALAQTSTTYFQQVVNYEIHVTLDDKNHQLTATETIEYKNNSPHPIDSIFIHLWPNAYKKYNTALAQQKVENKETNLYYAPDHQLGYIDGLDFKVNDKSIQWKFGAEHEDICIVYLPQQLQPGESTKIFTPFNVKLPLGIFSRLGHIHQSYQITQWYPKPAVFDKDGWHPMPYLDQGEFYSEYGSFDVFITLPDNYVVGATGDLIDGEKEIEWLNQKAIKTAAINNFDYDMSFPVSSENTKTLHYHQENVHDFAWFADKRYHVLKGEVELPHSKRKVTTWAMFTNNEANLWKNSIEYLNDATYYYSSWNGDYPYNQVTAVDGALSAGGGMEYPNVTVIGESGNAFRLETVIMHEVGHNWFYGILGSNERDHPWMDEGLNSMNENRYIETKYPSRRLLGDSSDIENSPLTWFDITHYKHKASYELMYLMNARKNLDQPIEEKAANYTSFNYGAIVYSKTALVFDYLMAYLGEEVYDKCMQRYFNEWKFKHPQPEDLRKVFEEETAKDLSWFFDDLIKTTKKIDYKIVKAKNEENNTLLKISNKGGIASPFSISGIKDKKIITTQWYEPIANKDYINFPKGDFDSYKIDAQLDIPEIKRSNNTLKTKGLFKTMEPLRLQWAGSIENPEKTQLFYTPIAGWNNNDKFMFGMALYNTVLPTKKLEYVVAPLYSISSENTNGYVSAYYHILPTTTFQDIKIGTMASSFTYLNYNPQPLEYYKIAPSISFDIKKKRARQFHSFNVSFTNFNIFEEKANYYRNGLGEYDYKIELEKFYINSLKLSITNKQPINPFDAKIELQQANHFIKMNLLTNYRFSYKKEKTGFDIRFFAGKFLSNNDLINTRKFNYNLSGGEASDYLYNEIFLGRNSIDGVLNQQFAVTDGGFKNLATPEADGRFITANNWITALNLKSNVFSKNLSIYADFGLVGEKINNASRTSDLAYDFGIALNIIPNIFEVYFPVKMSSNLNQLNYGEKIRFTLNINTLNPFKMIREFEL